ncbi:MAG TPA: YfhO family protein [Longimicrobium sp.]|nr:YfhO family protein [Longimicrobium sp.]
MKKTAPPPRRASTLAAPAETEPGIGAGLAAAIYFGLALVYFLPAFLPGRHIYGTDYLNAGYFFYDFISQRTADGALPGWVPYVYGGLPLFSNPGSTYYPVRWLADLLGPTRLFLPILFVVQFALAGWGMYLLAREMGCRRWVAFLAGLAFQWTGILTSWVYAGHDGRIIVVTLAPLLFYFLHRGIRTARLAPFAGAAATIGFALLSFQIQNAYYLLLGGLVWAVFLLVSDRVYRETSRLGKTLAMGIGAVAFGFLLASVNFLPFQDYIGESPRGMTGGRGYEYSTSFSMPWRGIAGIAVPEQVGANVQNERGEYVFPVYRGANAFRLHTEYLGALVVVLVALGAYYARRNRYWWFFTGLGLFGLSLALGGNTPLYRLYYELLPGLKRFRAPDLAYFVLALSLISMAAVTLERLAQLREARAARRVSEDADAGAKVLPVIAGGVVALAVLGALAFGAGSAAMAEGTSGLTPAQGWMRFAFFAAAVAGALWMWWTRKMGSLAALLALSLITTADLWIIGRKFFQTVDAPEIMFAPDDVTAFLQEQRRPYRVFPVPGQSAWPAAGIDLPMMYGIEQAGGEHGNQLERYNEFAGKGERTMVDFHNLTGDPRFLAAANVRYIVISAEVQIPWLREVFRGQQAIVYENALTLPRAYLAQRAVAVREGAALAAMQDSAWDVTTTAFVETARPLGLQETPLQGNAQVTRHEPDRVTVRTTASRPALLVLSDNWYKDWHAAVDGREVPIHRTNHTFRGVVVPQGEHTVEFTFRPAELRTGFTLYLAGFALLAAYGLFLLLRVRRRRDDGEAAPAPAAEA